MARSRTLYIYWLFSLFHFFFRRGGSNRLLLEFEHLIVDFFLDTETDYELVALLKFLR